MVSTSIQKSEDLSNNSIMKPTETFPDNNLMFRFSHFILRYRLHRNFTRKSFIGFQMISTLLHKKFALDSYDQLEKTWKSLYPPKFLSKMNIKRWTEAFIKYNIELFLDTTFYLSLRSPKNTHYFTPIEGLEHIQSALKKGKGALFASNHFGEYNHSYISLVHQHVKINGKPQKIKMVALTTPENEFLFREVFREFPNLNLILTGSFQELRKKIEKFLAMNYLILVGQDFYHPAQYRVPFNYGKLRHNFLVPCPQMLSYFYFKHGTPIIPVVALPGKNLKHSTIKFFPEISLHTCDLEEYPEKLQADLVKYRKEELPYTKHFGLLSTIINKTLNPYILTKPYLWQEAFVFFERTHFRIPLKEILHLGTLFRITAEKLLKLIEKSYEPCREDEIIVEILEHWRNDAIECENENNAIGSCQIQNKYIEMGRLSSASAFHKVIRILRSQQSSQFHQHYPKFEKYFDELLTITKFR